MVVPVMTYEAETFGDIIRTKQITRTAEMNTSVSVG